MKSFRFLKFPYIHSIVRHTNVMNKIKTDYIKAPLKIHCLWVYCILKQVNIIPASGFWLKHECFIQIYCLNYHVICTELMNFNNRFIPIAH